MSRNQLEIYSAERAALLFGSYRRGDANDPDTYVAAVAAVLALFDYEIIREATDPRTGIQTSEKFESFMPNSGEIKRHCERIAAHRERMAKLAAIPRPAPADRRLAPPTATEPGSLANVFVPNDHRRYGKLVEWSKTADVRKYRFGKSSDGRPGIWVGLEAWEGNERSVEQWKGYTAEDLLRIYRPQEAAHDDGVPFE